MLNPKAWVNPPTGQDGTGSAYYGDYREQRRPSESLSIGRDFVIAEGVSFSIRGEFSNVFNRAPVNAPTSTNAGQTQTIDPATGRTLAGFGRISPSLDLQTTPRNGVIHARLRF